VFPDLVCAELYDDVEVMEADGAAVMELERVVEDVDDMEVEVVGVDVPVMEVEPVIDVEIV